MKSLLTPCAVGARSIEIGFRSVHRSFSCLGFWEEFLAGQLCWKCPTPPHEWHLFLFSHFLDYVVCSVKPEWNLTLKICSNGMQDGVACKMESPQHKLKPSLRSLWADPSMRVVQNPHPQPTPFTHHWLPCPVFQDGVNKATRQQCKAGEPRWPYMALCCP